MSRCVSSEESSPLTHFRSFLRSLAPSHPVVAELQAKSDAFDEAAAKFAVAA